jgi:hypothetical protein
VIGILKGLQALDLDPETDSLERLHDLLGKMKAIPRCQLYSNSSVRVPNTIIKDSSRGDQGSGCGDLPEVSASEDPEDQAEGP